MFDLAERVAGWIFAIQITSPSQWVLRLTLVVAGLVARELSAPWIAPELQAVWGVGVLVLLMAAALFPDSTAPLFAVALISTGWLFSGGEGQWWRYASVAALLAITHLAATYAAAAPFFARTRRSAT